MALQMLTSPLLPLFFFNDTATPEIYPLSLHDALPIFRLEVCEMPRPPRVFGRDRARTDGARPIGRAPSVRSEEHTSELQSQSNLVCRLLLEKKTHHALPVPRVCAARVNLHKHRRSHHMCSSRGSKLQWRYKC